MQIQEVTTDFPTDTARQLRVLAAAVRRLGNSLRHNPEQLIEERELIERTLYAIASDVERRAR